MIACYSVKGNIISFAPLADLIKVSVAHCAFIGIIGYVAAEYNGIDRRALLRLCQGIADAFRGYGTEFSVNIGEKEYPEIRLFINILI